MIQDMIRNRWSLLAKRIRRSKLTDETSTAVKVTATTSSTNCRSAAASPRKGARRGSSEFERSLR